MDIEKRGVVLVGHGGIPKDCPQELVTRLKRLEAQRRAAKMPRSPEEIELDMKIRRWPRTSATDPYQSGLEALAMQLQPRLNGVLFAVAYNEFCAPTLVESVEELIKKGATHIIVITTMFTPGGSHSEIEIPEILDHLRPQYPEVELRYAWPFDLQQIAHLLTEQIQRFSHGGRSGNSLKHLSSSR
jgi:sirohydrochlorin cobaltochelatase